MSNLDDLERVARLRIIGSPPHSLQLLGTLELVRYVGTIGRINKLGTIATIGTVLLTVHAGTIDQVRRVGTQKYLGTVNRVAYALRIGTLSRLGTQAYLGTVNRIGGGRLGTVGHLGTMPYLGTVNRVAYIPRLGTIGRLGTVPYLGTVNRIGGGRLGSIGQIGTVPAGIAYQRFIGTPARRPVHLGQGSTWVGSWQHVGSYHTKTFQVYGRGTPAGGGIGSLSLVTAVAGTGRFKTGTYYGPSRIGSYTSLSFTEAFRYVRPVFRKSGTYSGTVAIDMGLSAL